MNCAETKRLFSPYLDGRVSGSEMRALTRHVAQCTGCEREYAAMQRTQQLLAGLGPKRAPADLALKLRLAISRAFAIGAKRAGESAAQALLVGAPFQGGNGIAIGMDEGIDLRCPGDRPFRSALAVAILDLAEEGTRNGLGRSQFAPQKIEQPAGKFQHILGRNFPFRFD